MNLDDYLANQTDPSKDEDASNGEVCCGEDISDLFDGDDFWEALDLMETSRKMLESALQYGITPGRRLVLQNHCDDLAQFIGTFIDLSSGEEDEVKGS